MARRVYKDREIKVYGSEYELDVIRFMAAYQGASVSCWLLQKAMQLNEDWRQHNPFYAEEFTRYFPDRRPMLLAAVRKTHQEEEAS